MLIGIILGLIGSGGSILAVPIFIYLFGIDEKLATGYSLFVVGFSALIGGLKQYTKGSIDFKVALIFGLPAILSVTAVRSFIIPKLPDELLSIGTFVISRRMGILGLFALVMLPAAYGMLKNPITGTEPQKPNKVNYNPLLILIEGLFIGSITGLVGAGGGFIIIPALVLWAKIEIKTAIRTSLVIVTLKSLIGFFLGDAFQMNVDWMFLLPFTCFALIGVFLGSYFNSNLKGPILRLGFGYFILLMSTFIFYMEFFSVNN